MVDLTPHGILGVVGCPIMEDEIVHVLTGDPGIARILIIENEESASLSSKLARVYGDGKVVRIAETELDTLPFDDGFSVLIWMKPIALHESPTLLREDMIRTLQSLRETCRSFLLFYGLCGNAFKDLEEVARKSDTYISILSDAKGQTADDCIGAILGGTEKYYEVLKSQGTGTFFLTPMWAARWKEMVVKTRIVPDADDLELMRTLFEMVGYRRVMKLKTGLGDQKEFDERVDEFARLFNFEKKEFNGCTLELVENSYENAKANLRKETDR